MEPFSPTFRASVKRRKNLRLPSDAFCRPSTERNAQQRKSDALERAARRQIRTLVARNDPATDLRPHGGQDRDFECGGRRLGGFVTDGGGGLQFFRRFDRRRLIGRTAVAMRGVNQP
jgi:hypothetical protein